MSTAFLHEQAAPAVMPPGRSELRELHDRLDQVANAVAALDARREELEELITDLMPAVNGAITMAIGRLDALEKDGTLGFARDATAAAGQLARTVDVRRLQGLAGNANALLHLAELAAAPELGAIMERTVSAVREADKGRAPTLRQLLRAVREPRVRRGMAAALNILRALGGGARGAARAAVAAPSQPAAPVRAAPAAAPAAQCAAPTAPAAVASARVLAGVPVELDAEGFLVDRSAWTRGIAQAIASEHGMGELTEAHWNVIDFCRSDAGAAGGSPGLRRITTGLGVAPREMYALFPKGPGMLAARIAGLPKPKSCV